MSGFDALPQGVMELISLAVTQAVQQTKSAMEVATPPKQTDYYKATEKLLYNYPKLKRLISDKESYVNVELRGRSKSVVLASSNPSFKSEDEKLEELQQSKENNFNRTLSEVRRIEIALELFEDRKEFIVIRMYYFGEDVEGKERGADQKQYTFEDIAVELERDIKTVRRWRSAVVNDIAVCLFGVEAAL